MKPKPGYNQLTLADGKLVCQLRSDMGPDEAVRLLRQVADQVELLAETERTHER